VFRSGSRGRCCILGSGGFLLGCGSRTRHIAWLGSSRAFGGRFSSCSWGDKEQMMKSTSITMKYVHTIEFKDEDFEETTALTVEEIRALGKSWMGKIWRDNAERHANPLLQET
jgi:hypothetical protein